MCFEKEVNSIKKMLNLGDEIKVYADKEASEFVNDNEEIYKTNYGVSLRNAFENGHGMYLWWENERTVIVRDSADIVNLAHELRHAWQHAHHIDKNFKFIKPKKSFWHRISGSIVYFFSRKELDANWYALKYAFRTKFYKERIFMALRPICAIVICFIWRLVFIPFIVVLAILLLLDFLLLGF